jgi:hypothetical protein
MNSVLIGCKLLFTPGGHYNISSRCQNRDLIQKKTRKTRKTKKYNKKNNLSQQFWVFIVKILNGAIGSISPSPRLKFAFISPYTPKSFRSTTCLTQEH